MIIKNGKGVIKVLWVDDSNIEHIISSVYVENNLVYQKQQGN